MPGLIPAVTEDVRAFMSFNARIEQELIAFAEREQGTNPGVWLGRSFLPYTDTVSTTKLTAVGAAAPNGTSVVQPSTVDTFVGNKTFPAPGTTLSDLVTLIRGKTVDRHYLGFWGLGDLLITNPDPTLAKVRIYGQAGQVHDDANVEDAIAFYQQKLPNTVLFERHLLVRALRQINIDLLGNQGRVADMILYGRAVDEPQVTITPPGTTT